jgi:hypothetical protein
LGEEWPRVKSGENGALRMKLVTRKPKYKSELSGVGMEAFLFLGPQCVEIDGTQLLLAVRYDVRNAMHCENSKGGLS